MNRNRNTENPFDHILKAHKRAVKYAVGTVRTHGGVKKRKMADGSWQSAGGKGAKPKTRRATIETRTPGARHHGATVEAKRESKKHDATWAKKYADVLAEAMNSHGVNAKVWQKKSMTRVYFFGTFVTMGSTGFISRDENEQYKHSHGLYRHSKDKIALGEAEYAGSEKRKALDRQREAQTEKIYGAAHEMHGTSDVDPFSPEAKVDPAVTRESRMIEAAKDGRLTQAMGEVYPGISWSEKDMKRIHSLLKVDPAEAGEYAAFFGERHAKEARKSHGVEQLSPLSKGKKYPIGTVRTHGGVKKRKTAQGWVTVKTRKKKRARGSYEEYSGPTSRTRNGVKERLTPEGWVPEKPSAKTPEWATSRPVEPGMAWRPGAPPAQRLTQEIRPHDRDPSPSPKQAEGVAEALMDRAAQMLQSVDASDAITRLLDDGYTESQAYLAVKAGKLLNKFRQERRKSHGGMELSSDDELWAMEKGRKNLPVGSKRTRKDGRTYIKQRNGEWRLVEEQKKKRGRKAGSTAKKRVARKRAPVKKRPATAKRREVSSKEDPNKAAIRIARLVGASEGAKRIGVAEKTFRKWAQGKSPVPQKHIKKLEKVFAEAKRAEGKAEGGQEGKEEYTKKRSRKPMRDDPKSEKEGLRWQTRLERAIRPFLSLIKAALPGAGWEPIRRPRGGKVGFRRRKKSGKGYDYFYPGAFTGKLGKEGQPVKPTKKKKKKKKGVQKERHTGIATTTEQIRSKYGHLGVGNVPVDSDRVDKDGNVVKKAVDLKKAQFVDLNPDDPSTKVCFKWKDLSVNPPEGKWKYGRARSLGQRNAGDKFDRVSKLLPNMRGIGAALGKVVSDEGASQNHRDAAAAIAIMADTGTRIGHIRHLKSSGTRGALSLLGKDIRVSKAGVFLEFSGKGGKKNMAEITNPAVAKYLRERVRGADKDGRLFSCTLRDMEKVRDKAGYAEHIFHDFRTARATILAADELASSPKPPPPLPKNKEEARALIMERVSAASIVVGGQLNNTPSMALESYIHPSVIWAYIQDVGGKAVAESFFKKSGDDLDGLTETKGGARLLRMAMSLKMPGPRGAQWSEEDQEIQPDVMDSYPLPDGLLKK
tara:strand:- start:112 stop:3402 length:3291 start_codon:yes stop_codon:yes gene_type:complete